eukprot:scaffold76449_cov17-Tisochrysis_lutea.AAC.2
MCTQSTVRSCAHQLSQCADGAHLILLIAVGLPSLNLGSGTFVPKGTDASRSSGAKSPKSKWAGVPLMPSSRLPASAYLGMWSSCHSGREAAGPHAFHLLMLCSCTL